MPNKLSLFINGDFFTMRLKLLIWLFLGLLGCQSKTKQSFEYPSIENKHETIEKYGISYLNNFRNLENAEKDHVFRNWLQKQDSISEIYFENKEFKDFLKRHGEYNSSDGDFGYDVKRNYNGLYYYIKDKDSTAIIYSYNRTENTEKKVFDSREYYDKNVNIKFYEPSINGDYIMISISLEEEVERESEKIYVFDVQKEKIISTGLNDFKSDMVAWVQWLPNDTFAYTGYSEQENSNKAHARSYDPKTNTAKLIYHAGIKSHKINPDGVPVPFFYQSQPNKIFVYDANASEHFDCYSMDSSNLIGDENLNWEKVFDRNDSIIYYADFDKSNIYFKQVNNSKVVLAKTSVDKRDFLSPDFLFTPKDGMSIGDFIINSKGVYLTQKDGISTQLLFLETDKLAKKIALDYPIGNINLKTSWGVSDSISITYEGWNRNLTEVIINQEGTFYILENLSRKKSNKINDIEVEIVHIESHDGVKVPLTLIKPFDFNPTKDTKAIISSYGAYGYSYEAYYDTMLLEFVSKGNIIAVAHIRGGGEKGHKWYEDGIKDKKFNSWKDLISCTLYLKENLLKHNDGIGLLVDSAGGISGAMAINERPDLFQAFSGINVTLNPIRIANNPNYQEDDNAYDFGSISTEEGFKALTKLDPVVNIEESKDYPATYLMCGETDELIPISEPSKYIAILQSIQSENDEPILLNVNYGIGHEYDDYITDFGKAMFFLENEISN